MDRGSLLAKKFVSQLKDGRIRKYILPNTAENYTVKAELEDFLLYKRFINSSSYDDIRECEVREYDGDNEFIL